LTPDELITEICCVVPSLSREMRPERARIDWGAIERQVGRLPSDYREIAEVFPRLFLGDFLALLTPLKGEEHRFLEQSESGIMVLREWCEDAEFTECGPYAAWPEPGGLLQWGESVEGDYFCWKTDDPDPDRWPVVIACRGFDWEEHDFGMLEYIVRALKGDNSTSIIPDYLSRSNLKVSVEHSS
jgi:hypothetical protein